jgi:hypothetical protein
VNIFSDIEKLQNKLTKKYIKGEHKDQLESKLEELSTNIISKTIKAADSYGMSEIVNLCYWHEVPYIKEIYHTNTESYLTVSMDKKAYHKVELDFVSCRYMTKSEDEDIINLCSELTELIRNKVFNIIKEDEIDARI